MFEIDVDEVFIMSSAEALLSSTNRDSLYVMAGILPTEEEMNVEFTKKMIELEIAGSLIHAESIRLDGTGLLLLGGRGYRAKIFYDVLVLVPPFAIPVPGAELQSLMVRDTFWLKTKENREPDKLLEFLLSNDFVKMTRRRGFDIEIELRIFCDPVLEDDWSVSRAYMDLFIERTLREFSDHTDVIRKDRVLQKYYGIE